MALSLQIQCLIRIVHYLDDYPPELLSLLPTRRRKDLLMSLTPLDICKLERTDVVRDIDMNEVWRSVCVLYYEPNNLLVTGNSAFDSRYLNSTPIEEDPITDDGGSDIDVIKDWKRHFLTRTIQILLHSFDPSSLSFPVSHNSGCNSTNDSTDGPPLECDCWGNGLDPKHQNVLQRLMTIPPRSYFTECYYNLEQRSKFFLDTTVLDYYGRLLVPPRYGRYFTANIEVSSATLLELLVKTCQFRPKLLPIHCEFMFHSELFQLYLNSQEEWRANIHCLLTELLSEVECLEFRWMGGLQYTDSQSGKTTYSNNPSTLIPKLMLEAVLVNPAPKLRRVCINMISSFMRYYMPKIDCCLSNIAPYLSASTTNQGDELDDSLPVSAPYGGLKELRVCGTFEDPKSDSVLSSIIQHQSVLEGIELKCVSQKLTLGLLLSTVTELSSQRDLRYLHINNWQVPGHQNHIAFKEIFNNFLNAHRDCKIDVTMSGQEATLSPEESNSSTSSSTRSLKLISHIADNSFSGSIFLWLHERKITQPLLSLSLSTPILERNGEGLLEQLSTCQSLLFESNAGVNLFTTAYMRRISLNTNLRVFRLNNSNSFISDFDEMHKMLSTLFSNSNFLTEVSFQGDKLCKLSSLQLESLFKVIFSYTLLEHLSVNLKNNNLQDSVLQLLVQTWKAVGEKKIIKSLKVDFKSSQMDITDDYGW